LRYGITVALHEARLLVIPYPTEKNRSQHDNPTISCLLPLSTPVFPEFVFVICVKHKCFPKPSIDRTNSITQVPVHAQAFRCLLEQTQVTNRTKTSISRESKAKAAESNQLARAQHATTPFRTGGNQNERQTHGERTETVHPPEAFTTQMARENTATQCADNKSTSHR
jgi:hypothetical protein